MCGLEKTENYTTTTLNTNPCRANPLYVELNPRYWLAQTAFGPAAGAICYDYDFPYLGLENARLNPSLVVLPSSDWKGIDSIHAQMASVRAIEGGYSLFAQRALAFPLRMTPRGESEDGRAQTKRVLGS